MKHIIKFSLTLLSVSVLAACGGGSGKGGNEVAQHLNNANSSKMSFNQQIDKANQATQSAHNAFLAAENSSKRAQEQSQLALDTFKNPMKNRNDINKADSAKNAAEKEQNSAKIKLEEAKLQVNAAKKYVETAITEVEKAKQNAINAAIVAEERTQNQGLVSPNLSAEQRALLEASQALSLEQLNNKVAETRRIASEMESTLLSAQSELAKAEQLQQNAEKSLTDANTALQDNLKSINLVNPKDRREHLQELKESKTLHIGIHEISLADENFGYITKDIEDKQLKVYNLGYSGVGYVLSKNVQTDEYGQLINPVIERHEIGENTASLPKGKDIFTYYGQSFGAKTDGVLTLKADFTNKTVEGTVTERRLTETKQPLSDITLQRAIIGASDKYHFEGVASYKTGNTNVTGRYEGNFKGNFAETEAQEVVGYIFDSKDHFYEGFAGKAEVNESILGNKKP
ncbi:factor H binding protein domain-containing protein [Frederiksenia canicola]|uniref:Factor H binding protein-like C-terminal domain-containing protein n=1 Tax=Frederiksenia canicola TaxID=123824 RepID=A0AAE6X573_9PAST|nr:factor H binding protein domain-containing protein [Frederiksenia canicola]QIM64422.1 hypothetical protein A4G17_02660 [Frederiksenia canicola]RPE91958.1 hypothetical protein EDC49_1755 [Frederiksenia canicola]